MNPRLTASIGRRQNRSSDFLETKLTRQYEAGADLVEIAVGATKVVTPYPGSAPARLSKTCSHVPKISRVGNADHGGRTRRWRQALNGSHGVGATKVVTPYPGSASARLSKRCSHVPKISRVGNADHGGRTRRWRQALNGSQGVGEINMETTLRKVAEAAEADVRHGLRIQKIPDGSLRHQPRWTSVLRSRTPEAVFKTMTVRRVANLAI